MLELESQEILLEFENFSFKEAPNRKNNSRFRGHIFASILMKHIAKYTDKFSPVLGPVWIKDLEWIEWDGAVIKKGAKEILPQYYNSNDIAGLFEFKVHGIYGGKYPQKGKKTVQEVVKGISDNFENAKKLNKNICCFYISLQERKPVSEKKRKNKPINYYAETKKLPVTTCILFESNYLAKGKKFTLDSWDNVIEELRNLKV